MKKEIQIAGRDVVSFILLVIAVLVLLSGVLSFMSNADKPSMTDIESVRASGKRSLGVIYMLSSLVIFAVSNALHYLKEAVSNLRDINRKMG